MRVRLGVGVRAGVGVRVGVRVRLMSSRRVRVRVRVRVKVWLLQHVWDEVASTYLSASPYISVYLRDVGHVELGSERLVVLVRVR